MRVDRSRQMIDSRRQDRAEPIVTYTRIEEAVERAEPRLGRAARDPFQDDIATLPHIDAPRAHVASDIDIGDSGDVAIDIDDLVEPADEPRRPRKVVRRKRSFGARLVVLTGFLAVVGGVGVLAATFSGMVGGSGPVNVEAPVAGVVHAADEPLAVDTAALATASSAGTIRVIGGAPAAPASDAAAVAALSTDAGAGASTARVMVDPPLPRLRPATASYNPPQTGPQASAAPQGAGAPVPNVVAVEVPAGQQPAAAPVTDLDSALASVDRILETQPVSAAPQGGAVGTLPYPVLEPLPRATADPYGVAAYPDNPGNAYPAVTGTQVYGPFLPDEEVAVNQPGSRFLPRRQVFGVPDAPIPPADVPNNTVVIWGQ